MGGRWKLPTQCRRCGSDLAADRYKAAFMRAEGSAALVCAMVDDEAGYYCRACASQALSEVKRIGFPVHLVPRFKHDTSPRRTATAHRGG